MRKRAIYIPGDQWLYFRIYGGHNTLDRLLREDLFPLIKQHLDGGMISLWFFIRYNDPDKHLRVRLKLDQDLALSEIIMSFRNALKRWIDDGLIWKVELGSYQPENERYGAKSMAFSEQLFFHDSQAYCSFRIDMPDHDDEALWLFAILSANDLLDEFSFNLHQKKELLLDLSRNFGKEFGKDKILARQLSDKYRKSRLRIDNLISQKPQAVIDNYLLDKIKQRSTADHDVIQSIINLYKNEVMEVNLQDLLSSLIHMSLNRIFINNNRMHEMVIYDFMHRYYRSAIARAE